MKNGVQNESNDKPEAANDTTPKTLVEALVRIDQLERQLKQVTEAALAFQATIRVQARVLPGS